MMKDTGSKATTDCSIRLGGNVKFSAESFVRPITVEETPTLCAVNDWTYSAGALTLRFGDDASLRAASGWMTVATVASGSAVLGLPALPSEEWQSRVVENGDGSKSLQCRLKTGMMLILN